MCLQHLLSAAAAIAESAESNTILIIKMVPIVKLLVICADEVSISRAPCVSLL
jgi:hypothetical protein